MKVITTFSVFLILARAHCFTRNSRVFIQFPNIEKYVWKYLQITNTEIEGDIYKFTKRVHYCNKLLAAPIYRLSPSHLIPPSLHNFSYHKIDENKWQGLKHLSSNPDTLFKRYFNIGSHSVELWSHPCVDHASKLSWLVTYDHSETTGLLFSRPPNLQLSSETPDLLPDTPITPHLSMEILNTLSYQAPNFQLSAFIDCVNSVQTRKASDPHNSLPLSLDISDSRYNEPLCQLKKSSQFRLCSICATAYIKFMISIRDYAPFSKQGSNTEEHVYSAPDSYFQAAESLGECPRINIINLNANQTMNALLCNMYFKGYNHEIYIKMNLAEKINKPNRVYVMGAGRNSLILKGDVFLPQLPSILNLDAILNDDDDIHWDKSTQGSI